MPLPVSSRHEYRSASRSKIVFESFGRTDPDTSIEAAREATERNLPLLSSVSNLVSESGNGVSAVGGDGNC